MTTSTSLFGDRAGHTVQATAADVCIWQSIAYRVRLTEELANLQAGVEGKSLQIHGPARLEKTAASPLLTVKNKLGRAVNH